MDYYKRYMGDYQRDTGDLSLAQHGAYTVLLDHYYSVRKPLPAAMEKLHRLCRATTKGEQEAVETIADEFFPVGQDGLRHNGRADEEIEKWEVFAEENREKGKLGGRPKKNPTVNPSGNPPGNPVGYSGDNPDETRRVTKRETQRFEKEGVLETRTKPYPDPNPNPEARSLNHSQNHTQSAREGEVADGQGGTKGDLPRGDDFEQLGRVKAVYPKGDYDQADWLEAQRSISRQVDDHGHSWEQIVAGAQRYGAQQAAKGNLGTQFVKSPKTFFACITGARPRFLEEFPVSESKAPEAGTRKRWHPDDGDPTEPKAATS